jgi:hypothetical protein
VIRQLAHHHLFTARDITEYTRRHSRLDGDRVSGTLIEAGLLTKLKNDELTPTKEGWDWLESDAGKRAVIAAPSRDGLDELPEPLERDTRKKVR